MSSLYIHIPFCHHKCIYCDFYSIAQRVDKDLYINSLLVELEEKKTFLNEKLQTIYFGGGTPSLLTLTQVEKILDKIKKIYDLSDIEEITFEINPEDAKKDYVKGLKDLGINRLSIGIESFDEEDLRFLNRSHTSVMARKSIENALQTDFENISIDLISNLPFSSMEKWQNNLDIFLAYNLPHISCYTLMIEENTMLYKLIQKGKYQPISEQESILQLDYTMSFLQEHNYIHYETSSYSKAGFQSKHNSTYWTFKQYLGIGAGAHSYKENIRMWNENDVFAYMDYYMNKYHNNNYLGGNKDETKSIHHKQQYKGFSKKEILSTQEQFEEYVMLSARMQNGLSLRVVEDRFPLYVDTFRNNCKKMIDSGLLNKDLSLTSIGWHLQDTLILNLCDI